MILDKSLERKLTLFLPYEAFYASPSLPLAPNIKDPSLLFHIVWKDDVWTHPV
jgi:hypothetical protein